MAQIARLAAAEVIGVPDYRAYEVGLDGHFIGSRVCDNDGDAVVWARQFSGDVPIELSERRTDGETGPPSRKTKCNQLRNSTGPFGPEMTA